MDLPGFGTTPPLPEKVSITMLAEAVIAFLTAHNLMGVDVVGTSPGSAAQRSVSFVKFLKKPDRAIH